MSGSVPARIVPPERALPSLRLLTPGVEIDVAREMMRATFDIILNTMLSEPNSIDCDLMQDAIVDYLEPVSWIIALAMIRAPRWVPYPGIHKARHARDRLHQVLDPLIIEAKRNPGRRDDLLSLLMNATDPKTNKLMNTTDVRYNLLTFITAGHETTALALTWTFYLLSLHPEVERRVTTGSQARPQAALSVPTISKCSHTRRKSYMSRCVSIRLCHCLCARRGKTCVLKMRRSERELHYTCPFTLCTVTRPIGPGPMSSIPAGSSGRSRGSAIVIHISRSEQGLESALDRPSRCGRRRLSSPRF
jgi:hypothetical protein